MAKGMWISRGQLPRGQEPVLFPDTVAGADFRGWDMQDALEPDVG